MHTGHDIRQDTTLSFLPHRLNRDPVVVRGLTADELWVCTALSATLGFLLGLPLAWISHSLAMVPTMMLLGVALGIGLGGTLLRRQKRGRPDIWLYRHLQWTLCQRLPLLARYGGGRDLILRSGYWTTRRSQP